MRDPLEDLTIMAHQNARWIATLLSPALLLAGCGRAMTSVAGPMAKTTSGIQARSVSPAQDSVLAGDVRRALYWAPDAQLVMAVQTTILVSTALSASANIFVSQQQYINGSPNVFVARHYGFPLVATYATTTNDAQLANGLGALNQQPLSNDSQMLAGIWQGLVSPQEAISIAKTFSNVPVPAPTTAPTTCSAMGCPVPAPTIVPANRFFVATRALLVQGGNGPVWNFYGNTEKFVIDATTRQVQGPLPAPNPADELNTGTDVDLQRASMDWLPMSPMQPINQQVPTATN